MTPAVSVLIPAYNNAGTIVRCLESLVAQAHQYDAEIIVVDSSADGIAGIIARTFPSVRLLHVEHRLFPDQARATGVQLARGALIAFIDADCTASPNWLSTKLAAHRSGHEIVFGNIRCHPDSNLIGWAYYFTEFSFYLQYTERGHVKTGATCNLSLHRELFELVHFREQANLSLDEQLLRDFRRLGKEIYFEPSHTVFHYYDRPLLEFLKHTFLHGRDSALLDYDYGTVRYLRNSLYLLAGPLLPLLKFGLLVSWVFRAQDKLRLKFISTIPATLCGVTAWTCGSWWAHFKRLPKSFLAKKQ